MRAWVFAALLLLPVAAVAAAGVTEPALVLLGTCLDEAPPVPVEGFAPLTMADGPKELDSTGFSCYRLYQQPSFGFHGRIVITLTDGASTAVYDATYLAAGAVPEEIHANSRPLLQPGLLTLRGEALAPDGFALGTWGGGVALGQDLG